ncbi:IS30 family transposase [Paucilactobacillus suebicus]|jgi:IS30 family transposase|uniref:Transposase n=1 Tax=Paucilactobacillus suebicus DSM 5007 = KCTC 3549 TaxID=1423807 RepID=A0A0R1VT97_9LACO|nr:MULTISPECIES: IS30 family transposase [Lactobacillaceae]KRM08993.1 transposase [Paucilactobacillus suebicus DSM 5007 = KCTC 3549]
MTQPKSSTVKHYQQLTPEERGEIEAYLRAEKSQAEIAHRLHRSRSTISREIKRGLVQQRRYDYQFVYLYYADTSQLFHDQKRQKCHSKGLLKRCWLFFAMLIKTLKQRPRSESIDSFINAFKQMYPDKPCPSTPTVYRYIDQGRLDIQNIDLPAKLKRHVKGNHHGHARINKRLAGTSIEQRPASVNQRQSFGHWEGDLVKGKRKASEPALMTLTERKTRYEIIVKIPNYHATTCLAYLQQLIDKSAKSFKSITFDNGSEFKLLNQIKGPKIYFTHPSAPWERGSNENQNGLIREYIPKGQSLYNFTVATITQIQTALNQKHRRILDYKTAASLFQKSLTS